MRLPTKCRQAFRWDAAWQSGWPAVGVVATVKPLHRWLVLGWVTTWVFVAIRHVPIFSGLRKTLAAHKSTRVRRIDCVTSYKYLRRAEILYDNKKIVRLTIRPWRIRNFNGNTPCRSPTLFISTAFTILHPTSIWVRCIPRRGVTTRSSIQHNQVTWKVNYSAVVSDHVVHCGHAIWGFKLTHPTLPNRSYDERHVIEGRGTSNGVVKYIPSLHFFFLILK